MAPLHSRLGHRKLAEGTMVAQRVAILELDDVIVERHAAVELEEIGIVPKPVVAIAADACERHLVAAARQILCAAQLRRSRRD